MALMAHIVGDNPLLLWGLDSRTRLARQLAALEVGVADADSYAGRSDQPHLVLSADYLFELRTLQGLMQLPNTMLECPADGKLAAGFAPAGSGDRFLDALNTPAALLPQGINHLRPDELENFDGDLRKTAAPLLEPITAQQCTALESMLYGNAYKGITDLVTKWWWPRPARVIVGWCARAGISPNTVTGLGIALMLLATVLFAYGQFLMGLLLGWIMTLLDTVDGKLARVTVRASRIGHVLDHGMDIVHPPFWYVFWGIGLAGTPQLGGFGVDELAIAIVAGYVAGRVIEGLFHALGACSMFAWRPFDAYFRLVTARRNPCLIILTATTVLGRPDWGLFGVTAWTLLSSAIMLVRLAYATLVRLQHGPLESWLRDASLAAATYPRAYSTFSGTRSAYE